MADIAAGRVFWRAMTHSLEPAMSHNVHNAAPQVVGRIAVALAVSLLAMLLLVPVASALFFPLFEIGWTLCVASGLYTLRRLLPGVSFAAQALFCFVSAILSGAMSYGVHVFRFGERL
jgi:hypothetical protein